MIPAKPHRFPQTRWKLSISRRNKQRQQRAHEGRQQDDAEDADHERSFIFLYPRLSVHRQTNKVQVICQERNQPQRQSAARSRTLFQFGKIRVGYAEHADESRGQIHQAIDDPLIPPHGNAGNHASEEADAVDARAIDDAAIEGAEREAEILGAIDEERVVNFVDIISVSSTIDAARNAGEFVLHARMLDVTVARVGDAGDGDEYGREHQQIFHAISARRAFDARSGLVSIGDNYWIQERLETFAAAERAWPADPSAD